jgi:hypothetical protein
MKNKTEEYKVTFIAMLAIIVMVIGMALIS